MLQLDSAGLMLHLAGLQISTRIQLDLVERLLYLLHEDWWAALERSLCVVQRAVLLAWTVVADAALVEEGPLFHACMDRG